MWLITTTFCLNHYPTPVNFDDIYGKSLNSYVQSIGTPKMDEISEEDGPEYHQIWVITIRLPNCHQVPVNEHSSGRRGNENGSQPHQMDEFPYSNKKASARDHQSES